MHTISILDTANCVQTACLLSNSPRPLTATVTVFVPVSVTVSLTTSVTVSKKTVGAADTSPSPRQGGEHVALHCSGSMGFP